MCIRDSIGTPRRRARSRNSSPRSSAAQSGRPPGCLLYTSSRLMRFDTTAGDRAISRPAADMFPVRATREKISRSVMAVTEGSSRVLRRGSIRSFSLLEIMLRGVDTVSSNSRQFEEYCSGARVIGRGMVVDSPETGFALELTSVLDHSTSLSPPLQRDRGSLPPPRMPSCR